MLNSCDVCMNVDKYTSQTQYQFISNNHSKEVNESCLYVQEVDRSNIGIVCHSHISNVNNKIPSVHNDAIVYKTGSLICGLDKQHRNNQLPTAVIDTQSSHKCKQYFCTSCHGIILSKDNISCVDNTNQSIFICNAIQCQEYKQCLNNECCSIFEELFDSSSHCGNTDIDTMLYVVLLLFNHYYYNKLLQISSSNHCHGNNSDVRCMELHRVLELKTNMEHLENESKLKCSQKDTVYSEVTAAAGSAYTLFRQHLSKLLICNTGKILSSMDIVRLFFIVRYNTQTILYNSYLMTNCTTTHAGSKATSAHHQHIILKINAIMPLFARLNHSCDPNCMVMLNMHGSKCVVTLKAIKNIRSGDELCISYLTDVCQSRSDRQSQLCVGMCFDCTCTRCRVEKTQEVNFKQKLKCDIEVCRTSNNLNSDINPLISTAVTAIGNDHNNDCHSYHQYVPETDYSQILETCLKYNTISIYYNMRLTQVKDLYMQYMHILDSSNGKHGVDVSNTCVESHYNSINNIRSREKKSKPFICVSEYLDYYMEIIEEIMALYINCNVTENNSHAMDVANTNPQQLQLIIPGYAYRVILLFDQFICKLLQNNTPSPNMITEEAVEKTNVIKRYYILNKNYQIYNPKNHLITLLLRITTIIHTFYDLIDQPLSFNYYETSRTCLLHTVKYMKCINFSYHIGEQDRNNLLFICTRILLVIERLIEIYKMHCNEHVGHKTGNEKTNNANLAQLLKCQMYFNQIYQKIEH